MEYIKYKDFETLINSPFPNERALIIADALKTSIILISGVKTVTLYMLQPNITYEITKCDVKTYIMASCTKFIEDSFKALSNIEQELIKSKFHKSYTSIFTCNNISQYYNELYTKLTSTKNIWDKTLCEIHFQNGYMDLKEFKFKERQVGKHYITHFIDRDYIPSSNEQQENVLKYIRQIYTREDDLKCITMTIGSALSGLSNRDQDTLFLLGMGSSGKSFILNLTNKAIGCYFKEMNANTFSQNNKDTNKILNTYLTSPHIRISWVNEMEDTKIDASLFKTFCDGKLTTTVLYEDGAFNVEHLSKAIITANTMPNITIDTGVSRRLRGYTHKSSFTIKPNEVNEEENIYLTNKSLLDELVEQGLMNAWFDIIAQSCNAWLNGEEIVFTDNFDETKNTVILTNDWIQDFIDGNLIKTENSNDRIGKNKMLEILHTQCPNKHLSALQLLTCLKDKKIKYDYKARCDKIQGCYICVKFQSDIITTNNKIINSNNNGIDDGIDGRSPPSNAEITIDYKKMYEDALLENDKLKKQLDYNSDSDDDLDDIIEELF